MERIFIITQNSKINKSHRFRLTLADKVNIKDSSKNMALANLSIYYTQENIKSAYNNNKFKTSAPAWNDEFNLPDGSHCISDIQDYFEFIIKKHQTLTENPPIQIHTNRIKNMIVFKIKTGYKLELLSLETRNCQEAQKKMLIKVKTKKVYQNQNLLKLFQCLVIQSITIINKHQKYYLLSYQINNLVN